jgi:isoleucyl-tRNA synthetase
VEAAAATDMARELSEELNVKRITVVPTSEKPLFELEVKANMKSLGGRAGARLQEIKKAIEAVPAEVTSLFEGKVTEATLDLPGEPFVITLSDLTVAPKAPTGFVGVLDRKTRISLDTRISDELALEGLARDVIRGVQDTRKNAGLEMEDRIALAFATENPKLTQAITAHRDSIAAETLATSLELDPATLGEGTFTGSAKVDGKPLTIALKKV